MERWRTLTVVAAAALLSACAAPAGRSERAVWTWENESYAMVGGEAVGDEALRFLASKGIHTVYLYADAFRGQNLIGSARGDGYRRFLHRLHQQGLRAYALLGSAYLHTEEYVLPERRADALAMLRRVLDYNAAAQPDERFDGVNLDIEPHILAQWPAHREALLRDFLDLGQALMALKRQSGQSLPIGPAIPFWLDGIVLDWNGARKPVSEHVLDTYDYVALMDYRNHADGRNGLIALAQDEMDYARRVGRTVVIGVEVTPNDADQVTFDGLAEGDLERELRKVEEAFAGNPAFGGFAIHHYRSYRTWLAPRRAGG